MAVKEKIENELKIANNFIRSQSKLRAVCLVHDDWLSSVCDSGKIPNAMPQNNMTQSDLDLLLAPSQGDIPKPWNRISVKMIPKMDKKIKCLSQTYSHIPHKSSKEIFTVLANIAHENYQNTWKEAMNRYGDFLKNKEEIRPVELRDYNVVVNELLVKLYGCEIKKLNSKRDTTQVEPSRKCHSNVCPALAVLESDSGFYVLQPYQRYTLQDCVALSPAILNSSHAKPLFILYQILQVMHHCHCIGITVGNIGLEDVLIDEKLWVQLNVLSVQTLAEDLVTEDMIGSEISNSSVKEVPKDQATHKEDISDLVDQWVQGKISNFDYLMLLNRLAGRKMGDPNRHPVLPWVVNFKTRTGGYRDFTKSKYRLNKGDRQLDLTYDTSFLGLVESDSLQKPHHISDVLSDITYYVYKARQTSRDLLCAHVRTKWVPHEYPSSMQRMQEWTPDECIPEFFTDPDIFVSIHEDLPDLQIPPWCSTPQEFVTWHMSVLESEAVSEQLHHWIDLTFGYKLSGQEAIDAKNVCLQLVDDHTELTNQGVVQLFVKPHPQRSCSAYPYMSSIPPPITTNITSVQLKYIADTDPQLKDVHTLHNTIQVLGEVTPVEKDIKPEFAALQHERRSRSDSLPDVFTPSARQSVIVLPQDYNPLAALDEVEKLYEFAANTSNKPLKETDIKKMKSCSEEVNDKVSRDMQVFGCLIVEMFLSPWLRAMSPGTPLQHRYELVRNVAQKYFHELPRPVRHAVTVLLHLNAEPQQCDESSVAVFQYPSITSEGLPPPMPVLLLDSVFKTMAFPRYLRDMYAFLTEFQTVNRQILKETQDEVQLYEKRNEIYNLAKALVDLTGKYMHHYLNRLDQSGLELLLPYFEYLFGSRVTMVPAAWSLFGSMAREFGPTTTAKHFIKYLSMLYDGECTTPKHIKLYHRTFLIQLQIRLGLHTFLEKFSTLLIESVSGFKDFSPDWDRLQSIQYDADTNFNIDVRASVDESGDVDVDGEDGPETDEFVMNENETAEDEEDNIKRQSECSDLEFNEDFPDRISLGEDDDQDVVKRSKNSSDSASLGQVSLDRRSLQSGGKDSESEDLQQNGSMNKRKSGSPIPSEDAVSTESLGKSVGAKSLFSRLELQQTEGSDMVDETLKKRDSDASMQYPLQAGPPPAPQDEKPAIPPSYLVRSHTASSVTDSPANEYNVCDVATESVIWLAERLGPVLAGKYLSHNLMRMLALCYLEKEQLHEFEMDQQQCISTTNKRVAGDQNASKILECLGGIAVLYGEQCIVLQYFKHIKELISVAVKRLTIRAEAGLISCMVLLKDVVLYLSDNTLMEYLQDTIVSSMLLPTIKAVSSAEKSFPSGSQARKILSYKIIDVLYVICLRIGFEMSRKHMTQVLQAFFISFDQVHADKRTYYEGSVKIQQTPPKKPDSFTDSSELYLNIKMDSGTQEYKIGTPVNPLSPTRSLIGSGSWQKRSHSLTPMEPTFFHRKEDEEVLDEEAIANKEKILEELKETFTPEMAYTAYIPMCKVTGDIHMAQNLKNDDLLRKLCDDHDRALNTTQIAEESDEDSDSKETAENGLTNGNGLPVPGQTSWYIQVPVQSSANNEDNVGDRPVTGSFGKNVTMIGNKLSVSLDDDESLMMQQELSQRKRSSKRLRSVDLAATIDQSLLRKPEMQQNCRRHLKGNWFAYWEHEIGLSERDTSFNFKQILLQSYVGHTNSIRALSAMNNENAFISGSKDKTVKLWSLRNVGDGSERLSSQWTYNLHKKPVHAVSFLEALRLAASCDGATHIWDPFVGMPLRQFGDKHSAVSVITPVPAPSNLIVCGTNDATLRFLDVRAARYMHEFKCTIGPAGLLRAVSVSPNGNWVAVGYSTGIVSLLDIRTGMLGGTWKPHESEVIQVKAYDNNLFVSSSLDNHMVVWKASFDGSRYIATLKGQSEAIHCFSYYRDEVVSITPSNRVGVHTSLTDKAVYSSTKVQSDIVKGMLTSMAVLPMNRTLLLGDSNGSIKLLC